jgi:hypothetical protein
MLQVMIGTRSCLLSVCLTVAAGCTPFVDPRTLSTVGINNFLTVPVRVTADDEVDQTIGPIWGGTLSWWAIDHTFTWTPAPIVGPDGQLLASDLVGTSVHVGPGVFIITLSASMNDAAYFRPLIHNNAGVDLDVALVDSGVVRCLARIPPTDTAGVRLAYYRYDSTTEMRWYRGSSGCAGPSGVWPHATFDDADFGPAGRFGPTGLLELTAATAPPQ